MKITCIAALTFALSSVFCPDINAQDLTSLPLLPNRFVDSSPIPGGTKDVLGADTGDLPSKPIPVPNAETTSIAAAPIHVTPHTDSPVIGVRQRPLRAWLALSLVGQAAVLADVKTTLDLRHSSPLTFHESDPLARPFVNLPVPAYVASSVAFTAGLSLLSWRLSRSENTWIRRRGWLPQMAQTIVNAECAVHNARE